MGGQNVKPNVGGQNVKPNVGGQNVKPNVGGHSAGSFPAASAASPGNASYLLTENS